MSDREHFPSDSDSETDANSAHSDENTDKDEIFMSGGEILPYQDEPLATSDSDEECMSEETNDEDGTSQSVLEQRFNKTVSVENW